MIYKVITDTKAREIVYQANILIKEGYAPIGSLTIGPDGIFHQAMIHTQLFIANAARIQREHEAKIKEKYKAEEALRSNNDNNSI